MIDIFDVETTTVRVFNADKTIDRMIGAEARARIALHSTSILTLSDACPDVIKLFDDPLIRARSEGMEFYPRWVRGSTVQLAETQELLDYRYVTADPTLEFPHVPEIYDLRVFGKKQTDDGYRVDSPAGFMSVVLAGTGWTVGTVDVDERVETHTYRKSVLENLKHLQTVTGGWLVFDSINKTVSLRDDARWCEAGGRIAASGLTRVVDHSHITHRLALWGKVKTDVFRDGSKQELEISILGSGEHYPYIQDPQLFSLDPRERMGVSRQFDNGDKLRSAASQYLKALAKPLVSYEGFLDVKEPLRLGAMYEIDGQKARLLAMDYHIPQKNLVAVEFGDLLFANDDGTIFNGRLPKAVIE